MPGLRREDGWLQVIRALECHYATMPSCLRPSCMKPWIVFCLICGRGPMKVPQPLHRGSKQPCAEFKHWLHRNVRQPRPRNARARFRLLVLSLTIVAKNLVMKGLSRDQSVLVGRQPPQQVHPPKHRAKQQVVCRLKLLHQHLQPHHLYIHFYTQISIFFIFHYLLIFSYIYISLSLSLLRPGTCASDICVYMYIYIYVHICFCFTYIHTYLPTYIHTYIYIYIHTWMNGGQHWFWAQGGYDIGSCWWHGLFLLQAERSCLWHSNCLLIRGPENTPTGHPQHHLILGNRTVWQPVHPDPLFSLRRKQQRASLSGWLSWHIYIHIHI